MKFKNILLYAALLSGMSFFLFAQISWMKTLIPMLYHLVFSGKVKGIL